MKKYISLLTILICFQLAQAQDNVKFNHILITNDDGIGDSDRLLALATSVKKAARRVSVVVPAYDRSGTSNQLTYGKYQSTLEVACIYNDKENSIAAYTIPGNPGDCVILGLNGLFAGDRPDLVLSGINGGPNIGPDWFGSGTVGAARMAAFMGVKGIALSGFDDDDERSFSVIPEWITELISSGIVDEMDKNSYLTVGFPEVPLEEIKGVKIASRRISYDKAESLAFYKILGGDPHMPENQSVWALEFNDSPVDTETVYDDTYLKEGYIIITPMTISENDPELLNIFLERQEQIPGFSLK